MATWHPFVVQNIISLQVRRLPIGIGSVWMSIRQGGSVKPSRRPETEVRRLAGMVVEKMPAVGIRDRAGLRVARVIRPH